MTLKSIFLWCLNRAGAEITAKLDQLLKGQAKIMKNEQEALDLMAKIDAATTKQGESLAAEGLLLQKISDNIDALIVEVGQSGGVSDDLIARLQAEADKSGEIADKLAEQAAFSSAVASKGVENPIPVPVPEPTGNI